MANELIPNYVDIDYSTIIEDLKIKLKSTNTFKDYNFEGANITVLMEMLAYLGEMNTYYTNQLAKNIHPETANVYETVHSLSRRQGYEPRGYWAAKTIVTITLQSDFTGKQLYIPAWYPILVKGVKSSNNEDIYYTTVKSYTITPNSTEFSFDIEVIQGEPTPIKSYLYSDAVDNRIILPLNEKYDHKLLNDSIQMFVGPDEVLWTRTEDPFDNTSPLYSDMNVYMVRFDKYQRYVLQFLTSKNIPRNNDLIQLRLVKTLGSDGDIPAGCSWTISDTENINGVEVPFIRNLTDKVNLTSNQFISTNILGSAGSGDIDTIDDMKFGGEYSINTQRRDVTRMDYTNHLLTNDNIIKAGVWGEKEQNAGLPITGTDQYNKVYISIIPDVWGDNTIIKRPYIIGDWPSGLGSTGITCYNGDVVRFNDNIFQAVDGLGFNGSYTIQVISTTGVSGPIDSSDPNITWIDRGPLSQFDRFDNATGMGPTLLQTPRLVSPSFSYDINSFLEPKKMIGTNEVFLLPELVYFKFDIGVTIKRSYNFSDVQSDILNKLIFFFSSTNRSFGDRIDPREIENYIKDSSIVERDGNGNIVNSFIQTRGIITLTVRDIITCTPTLINYIQGQPNNSILSDKVYDQVSTDPKDQPMNNFPFYVNINLGGYTVNYSDIKPIQLNYKQFPVIVPDYTNIFNEGN